MYGINHMMVRLYLVTLEDIGRQLDKSYVAPVVYAKCTPFYFVNNDLCMPEIYLVLSCLVFGFGFKL